MHVRELDAGDEPKLVIFSCAGGGRQAWSHAIERMVREHLTEELVRGTARAVGWFADDGHLAAVVAWQPGAIPMTWHVPVLAVATGNRHRHLGTWAKRELLRRARTEGIRTVFSWVHRDNEPMLKINERLAAKSTGTASAYVDHVELAIAVLPEHAYSWAPTMRCPEHGAVRPHPSSLLATCPGPVGATSAGIPATLLCGRPLQMPPEHTVA